MLSVKYFFGLVGILAIGKVYEKWRKSNETDEQIKTYQLVKEYLLNESSLAKSSKPILWIHIPHEINARNWINFNSRNSKEVNRPYLYLSIKTIVDNCSKDFNVCLINDKTFGKILPGWTIELDEVAEPTKQTLRLLALSQTLYFYGGMLVPPSLLCFDNLHNTYNNALSFGQDAFVGEFNNRNYNSNKIIYAPNTRLMGCKKNSKTMQEFSNMLSILISTDYTNEHVFLGNISQWWSDKVNRREAGLVDAKKLGVETPTGPMNVEKLLGSTFYNLDKSAVAVYLPEEDITKRSTYQWFERQSPEQTLNGDYLVGKYFLAALSKPICQ
jgi:hypothetical protein